MKKTTVFTMLMLASSLLLFSCATEVEKTPAVTTEAFSLPASNGQLARYPVSGFDYKSSEIPDQPWERWAKTAQPIVKGIIDKIPDGYVLEVRGHTDARGPEYPEGDKPGNNKISTDRAKAVYDALDKAGAKSSKMTYKGVGSTQPIPGVDTKSGQQRRVTFAIVAK
ncbi:MAG: hypothetical protein A2W19_13460 [Spirochaetes bacterium RBG_16_49_21]|nr:MAG: hypothetical protein A2W19_13460 [Spirochaetes bacterium RBG_16_49_21]